MSDKFNIKMTETLTGADNGFTDKRFEEGESYIVGASLFNSFKNMGACELVEAITEEKPKVTKIVKKKKKKKAVKKVSPVVENKATAPVIEDK